MPAPSDMYTSNAVKMVFCFCFGAVVGPEIVDFGPLPGQTRPRGDWGKPGPRSISTDFLLGRRIIRPFCEVC